MVGVLSSMPSFGKGYVVRATTKGMSKYIVKTVFITEI